MAIADPVEISLEHFGTSEDEVLLGIAMELLKQDILHLNIRQSGEEGKWIHGRLVLNLSRETYYKLLRASPRVKETA